MKILGVTVLLVVSASILLLQTLGRTTPPRMKSKMQTLSILQAATVWAIGRDYEFPSEATWVGDLIDAGLLYEEPTTSYGADVEPVYYYMRPTPAQYQAMLDTGGSEIVVVYEHAELWRGDGGHVGYLDGRVEWIDGSAYRRLVESLLEGGGG